MLLRFPVFVRPVCVQTKNGECCDIKKSVFLRRGQKSILTVDSTDSTNTGLAHLCQLSVLKHSTASPPVCLVGRRMLRNLGYACNPPCFGQWHYIPPLSHRSGKSSTLLWRGQKDVFQNVSFSKPSLINLANT